MKIDKHDFGNTNDSLLPQMSLDGVGLLVGKASLLALAQLLDQTHGLSLEAAGELAADAAREQLHKLWKESQPEV